MDSILEIKDLNVSFLLASGKNYAVRDVSLVINKGETLGLVGESGCGKSVTAFSILKLIKSPGRIDSGKILYKGKDILSMSEENIRSVRGRNISMIFQEPMTSLNPVFKIGFQISSAIMLHLQKNRKDAEEMTIELLNHVGIPDPAMRYNSYPHELSGGMKQRVLIALALCANPEILIADEPTTALDTTIQAQILDLLLKVQEKRQMSFLIISHDLGVIANTADYVAVMYAGEVVEYASVMEIYNNPRHPYTVGLFEAVPGIGEQKSRLSTIPGAVPAVTEKPDSCVFYSRCSCKTDDCLNAKINLEEKNNSHFVRCIMR